MPRPARRRLKTSGYTRRKAHEWACNDPHCLRVFAAFARCIPESSPADEVFERWVQEVFSILGQGHLASRRGMVSVPVIFTPGALDVAEYCGSSKLSDVTRRTDDEILRLRAQNDTRERCVFLTASGSRGTEDDAPGAFHLERAIPRDARFGPDQIRSRHQCLQSPHPAIC
jgi:hypothetical protein